MYGKTAHVWDDFPYTGRHPYIYIYVYMGRLPASGKSPIAWETLPIHGKTSHVWEDFPYMGRLPICGKTSHLWEDLEYMGRPPNCEKAKREGIRMYSPV